MNATRSFRLTLGPDFTEGARQVWLWMEREKKSQANLIALLAADDPGAPSAKGLLPKYLYGDQPIAIAWARRIERVTGVLAGLWGDKPVEPFTPPAVAAAQAALAEAEDAERPTGT
jgi:hypothetical protein